MKGIIGLIGILLAGGIIGIILLLIFAIIAWYVTNNFCFLCNTIGPIIEKINPGWSSFAWWIQFFIVLIILRKLIPFGK